MSPIAVVTGAGSGIGRATVVALAGMDFTVVLAGRRQAPLEAAAAEAGSNALALICDVRDPRSVAALFAEIDTRFGRLDLLFNNAGVGAPAVPLENLGLEQWTAVIETNVTGAFLCTQEAFRIMKRQSPRGGRIINNGSISAHVPRPLSAPYTAAKHAITGLTKSTSLDGRAVRHRLRPNRHRQRRHRHDRADAHHRCPSGRRHDRLEPTIESQHVARAVAYMATLPLDANVQFMTVMATKMPYIGRG